MTADLTGEDLATPAGRKRVMREFLFAEAEFVTFEESGHNPQVEEPSKLFVVIKEFLRK